MGEGPREKEREGRSDERELTYFMCEATYCMYLLLI